jgi:hypothetical protein
MNFNINEDYILSNAIRQRGCKSFSEACKYLSEIPYGRNTNRENPLSPLLEHKGTCTTKHHFLAQLAYENDFNDIEIMIGVFKMDGIYAPKLIPILHQFDLTYIMEAHTYLRFEGKIFDYTSKYSNENMYFRKSLIHEIQVDISQLGDYKNMIHQLYLDHQSKSKSNKKNYSLTELWNIREMCIKVLGS